jgi:hypothetical protein
LAAKFTSSQVGVSCPMRRAELRGCWIATDHPQLDVRRADVLP